MKLKIKKDILFNAIKNAIAFTNKSHKIPTVANVLFKTENNKLILIGSDLVTEGKIEINELEIFEQGSFLTNTTTLFNIIKLSSVEDITLETTDSTLIFQDLDSKYELSLLEKEDFSEFNISNENFKILNLKTNKLKKAINETIFSINPLHYRSYLTGINIKNINNTLQFTGSDNYRISFSYIKIEEGEKIDEIDIILPKKTAQHIKRLINSYSNDFIEIKYSENFLIIKINEITITSKLIDEKYPDTSSITSLEYPYKVIVDKDNFLKALKKASIFHSDAEDYAILDINKEEILIYSQDSASGKSINKVKTISADNEFKIAINPKYILDLEPILIGEKIILNLINNEEKILIQDDNNKDFKYYLVPYSTEDFEEEVD